MKYLKTFERAYAYLNKDDSVKIENYCRDFIVKTDIYSKINKMKFSDFEKLNFDYYSIFESFFTSNYYEKGNIYYDIRIFCGQNNIKDGPPLTNSLSDIFKKIYKDYIKDLKLKDRLDNKLISILEQTPEEYEDVLDNFEDEMSAKVKKACKWMLTANKYNL